MARARVEKQVISRVRWARGGICDKLGAESRPVIAAALWMCTAPAQIGGLEGREDGRRWSNCRPADKKGPIFSLPPVAVIGGGDLESAGKALVENSHYSSVM